MRYLSVCSGIEAATVAWHPLGWQPAAFSEIEAFPRAVLAHHYPEVPLHGDFTTIKGDEYGTVDLLVGGTPCQSFSVAGLRKGLDDPRGNLMLEYGALAKRLGAKWLVWENVPGVLSANGGRDFGTFLGMLAELGYGFAYRVLDAQYFGVAQRRRRVFVVGCLGDWRAAAAVLFERHSLQGNPAPSREARKAITGTLSSRTTGGGGLGTDFELAGVLQPVAQAFGGNNQSGPIDVATARNACGSGSGRLDFETETFLVQPALSVALRGREGGATAELGDEVSGCLRASSGGGDKPHVLAPIAFDTTQITSATNRSNPQPGDPCHPLAASAHPPTIAFNARQDPDSWTERTGLLDTDGGTQAICVTGDITHTLKAEGFDASEDGTERGQPIVASLAFAQNTRDEVRLLGGDGEIVGALAAQPGMKQTTYVAPGGMAVRRLTPRECERLQGFPDDYTLVPVRGKPAADGPRYKALGNSMAVPVMAWIGKRIAEVDAILLHDKRKQEMDIEKDAA